MDHQTTLNWRRRWNIVVIWRWRLGAGALLTGALLATIEIAPRPRLLWNATASTPIGLYAIAAPRRVATGEMVVAWLPLPMRRFAAERRYLPINVPVIKRIGAVSGDLVCASGERVTINRALVAVRRPADVAGRPLPRWTGCRRLADGELLLLSAGSPLAFDGRYVGVTRRSSVIGTARLVWPRA